MWTHWYEILQILAQRTNTSQCGEALIGIMATAGHMVSMPHLMARQVLWRLPMSTASTNVEQNQESSSEDMMHAYAIKMWGHVTGNADLEKRYESLVAFVLFTDPRVEVTCSLRSSLVACNITTSIGKTIVCNRKNSLATRWQESCLRTR